MFDERFLNHEEMTKLGELGEWVAYKVLTENYNADVKMSDSQWDSEKDMTINGAKCEVKTQIPFITENSFAVKQSQWKKCAEAEVLIFVEVPYRNRYGVNESINVWLSKRDERKGKRRRTKDDRDMIMYSKEQMTKIATVDDTKLCRHMEVLSQTQV